MTAQLPQGTPSGSPTVLDQVVQAGTVQTCPWCHTAVGGMRDYNRHMRANWDCQAAERAYDLDDRRELWESFP